MVWATAGSTRSFLIEMRLPAYRADHRSPVRRRPRLPGTLLSRLRLTPREGQSACTAPPTIEQGRTRLQIGTEPAGRPASIVDGIPSRSGSVVRVIGSVSAHPSSIISPGEAHVWSADPAVMGDWMANYLPVLSVEEKSRMSSFRFERDRVAYGAAHVLARAALTWCAPDVSPASWDLTQRRHERPEVVAPQIRPRLRFNISHTHGLVACLVTSEIDCGVDVEVQRRVEDMDALATRVLSPAERSDLMALPDDLRPARFFRYWTLKEAYVKGRGLGLSLPVDEVSFDISTKGIEVAVGPSVGDDGADWQFDQWTPTEYHIVAVALRSGPTRGVRVVRHSNVPGLHFTQERS